MSLNYTLLGKSLLISGRYRNGYSEEDGFGVSGLAVLSDGTFFASIWIEQNRPGGTGYPLRMWHLAKDLTVLGTIDVPVSNYYVPYAVPMSGNRVMSILSTDAVAGTYPNYEVTTVTIVDCSGNTPVPGPTVTYPASTFFLGGGGIQGPTTIMDYPHNRVIISSYGGIQIFSLADGVLLGSWSQYRWGVMDFAQDVLDSTHFVGTDANTKDWDFTIGDDNTITLNRSFDVPYDPNYPAHVPFGPSYFPYQYPIGAAALPLPSNIVSANDDPDQFLVWPEGPPAQSVGQAGRLTYGAKMAYYNGPGAPLAELSLGRFYGSQFLYESERNDNKRGPFRGWQGDGFVNVQGTVATMASGRHQVLFYEHGASNNYRGLRLYTNGDAIGGTPFFIRNDGGVPEFWWRLLSVDRQHPELGFETMDLFYMGFPPPGDTTNTYDPYPYTCTPPDASAVSVNAGSPGLAIDQDSGVMLVGMSCVNRGTQQEYMINFMLWAIQGPAGAKPNLAGNLLDDRVRFTP